MGSHHVLLCAFSLVWSLASHQKTHVRLTSNAVARVRRLQEIMQGPHDFRPVKQDPEQPSFPKTTKQGSKCCNETHRSKFRLHRNRTSSTRFCSLLRFGNSHKFYPNLLSTEARFELTDDGVRSEERYQSNTGRTHGYTEFFDKFYPMTLSDELF